MFWRKRQRSGIRGLQLKEVRDLFWLGLLFRNLFYVASILVVCVAVVEVAPYNPVAAKVLKSTIAGGLQSPKWMNMAVMIVVGSIITAKLFGYFGTSLSPESAEAWEE